MKKLVAPMLFSVVVSSGGTADRTLSPTSVRQVSLTS
jgi:hypothetical protein